MGEPEGPAGLDRRPRPGGQRLGQGAGLLVRGQGAGVVTERRATQPRSLSAWASLTSLRAPAPGRGASSRRIATAFL